MSRQPATPAMSDAPTFTVRDTTIPAMFDAAGIAEPIARATLSTRLMGSVTEVLVREGDRVRSGEPLARIDARDVEARRAQVDAGIAAAEALYQDARTQADRFRALYADSAATRYQLEQVETGLARAEAGLQTARASRAELDAVGAYAEIRAPFSGIVTRRFVDPGAFAAPGAPIVEVQDASRLRVSVTLPPASCGRHSDRGSARREHRGSAGARRARRDSACSRRCGVHLECDRGKPQWRIPPRQRRDHPGSHRKSERDTYPGGRSGSGRRPHRRSVEDGSPEASCAG